MATPLNILMVEDSEDDAVLLAREMETIGFDPKWKRVQTEAAYQAELSGHLDIIFSDFTLPRFSTARALELLRESGLNIPFIIVSGTIGEERAVESLKSGATDYVLKDHLKRIGPVVRRALREASEREARKLAYEALRKNEAFSRAILASALDCIIAMDHEGKIVEFNPAAEQTFGYTRAEALGQEMVELIIPPAMRERHRRALADHASTNEEPVLGRRLEMTVIRKNGTEFPIELAITGIVGSEPPMFTAFIQDVTEKKNLEAQTLRNQRIESIGTLAGGIAHDLNNVLAPIVMSVQLLRMKFPDPESAKILDILARSAQHGSEMVKQVLTFSRGLDGNRVVLQLKHLIKEMETIIAQTFPKTIRLRTVIAEDLWPVMGDATQLHQVLLNLCVNSRDAMPDGGTLSITAENTLVDEPFARMNPEARPGLYVIVRVTDTGTGIPAEICERIWDPFFTTKPKGQGTGLGLPTVRSIVKSHGGFVTVYSEPSKGTSFTAYIAANPDKPKDTVQAQLPALLAGKGETILVVDDEASVRSIAQQTLEMFGYRVLTAADGAQAVALCAQNPGKINLMLADVMMPLMGGREAIAVVRKFDAGIRFISASGLPEEGRGSDTGLAQGTAFLLKPFTAERLLKTIREVLDQQDPGATA